MTDKPKSKYQIGDVVEFSVGGFGVVRECEWIPNGPYYHYATSDVEGLPPHPKGIYAWFHDVEFKDVVATSVRQIDHVLKRPDVQAGLAKIQKAVKYDRSVRTTHGVAKRLLSKPDITFKSTHQLAKELLEKEDCEFEMFVDETPVNYSTYLLPDPGIKKYKNADDFFKQEGTNFFNKRIKSGVFDGFCPVCRTIGVSPNACQKCGTIIPYANAPVKGWS